VGKQQKEELEKLLAYATLIHKKFIEEWKDTNPNEWVGMAFEIKLFFEKKLRGTKQ
jgi:hypothetical protein